ncbi:hypothetical protein EH31_04030 [Erythrobacter longus]|uniref:Uncharacterized protein n=1 Tax=Erythrobacter longus TaxID=1044 RepID=A0A074MAL1_ERYLO|nr:hypothetical protein EH31_04030 [Erythrobacter longus]
MKPLLGAMPILHTKRRERLFLGELRFEFRDLCLERVGLFTRFLRHGFDRVEFFAAHKIHPAKRLTHTFTRIITRFTRHTGNRASSAVSDFHKIGEQWVLTLHKTLFGDEKAKGQEFR